MPKKQIQKETKQKRPAFSREKIEPKDVREFLPLDQRYFNYAKREIVDSASSHGFLFAEPQLSVPSSFFYKLNKKEEDALRKRLVSFPARVKTDEVCLRPEVLPLVIKSYLGNKSRSNYEMVKLFYLGSVFKKSKDKEVYLEEETKFGFEALGTEETTVVAELIALAYNLYSKFEFKRQLRK